MYGLIARARGPGPPDWQGAGRGAPRRPAHDQHRPDLGDWAVGQITADTRRSADTHLLRLPRAGDHGIQLYLKDESTHPTGSLKHRLARSLFLYALCNGDIGPGTTVVEASVGSTAVSEAYFARLVGLPFVAVMRGRRAPARSR